MPFTIPAANRLVRGAAALICGFSTSAVAQTVEFDITEDMLQFTPPTAEMLETYRPNRPIAVEGEYLVRLKPGSGAAGLQAGELGPMGVEVLDVDPLGGFAVVRLPDGVDVQGFLATDPRLEDAEPNFLYYPQTEFNDPGVDRQWMIGSIDATRAWRAKSDASDMIVAVIDSGVWIDHEDIRDNMWINAGETPGNRVDDDGNGFVDDIVGWDFGDNDRNPNPPTECDPKMSKAAAAANIGHGTFVASQVGAVGGNGVGMVGVAPRVKIMALKVQRKGCLMATDSIARAVLYAAANGAKVINLSLGGPGKSKILEQAIQTATDAGALVVTSAGNDGLMNDIPFPYMPLVLALTDKGIQPSMMAAGPNFPASYDNAALMSVAATRPNKAGEPPLFALSWIERDNMTPWHVLTVGFEYDANGQPKPSKNGIGLVWSPGFRIGSNFGQKTVDIAAPGDAIVGAIPIIKDGKFESGYKVSSGTSYSSPIVAGAAALLWSAFPEMTALDVKRRLMETVTPAPSLQGRVASGGALNLYAALCASGAPRRLEGCGGVSATDGDPDGGIGIAGIDGAGDVSLTDVGADAAGGASPLFREQSPEFIDLTDGNEQPSGEDGASQTLRNLLQ